jgi:hypothetical protein
VEVVACATGLLGLDPDPWNNTPGTAQATTVACGSSRLFSGTTVPVGTDDWFKVSYALTPECPELKITLTINGLSAVRFDLMGSDLVKLNGNGHDGAGCYETGTSITSPNPVWIRVWAPYVRANYVLALEEGGSISRCPLT